MSRISRSSDNIFDIPVGATVRKDGRVYFNDSNYQSKSLITGKLYTNHKKICIGYAQKDTYGNSTGRMFANQLYLLKFSSPSQASYPPPKSNTLSVGPRALIEKMDEEYGFIQMLSEVFEEAQVKLILDLSMYMLFTESAIFQHFPSWARRQLLFSDTIRSDSYISEFLGKNLDYSKIHLFCNKWGAKYINSGKVYFCYDSTNTNSQAEGIYIVQKGYAKDNKNLKQVNSDYIVRQEDGLPLTFMEFPGSIVDIAEAKTMISFIRKIKGDNDIEIVLVCDRGYISEDNLISMKQMGIGFLLMIRSNLKIYKQLIDTYKNQIKFNYKYCINNNNDGFGVYGITVENNQYIKETNLFFHIFFSNKLANNEYEKLSKEIESKSKFLDNAIKRQKLFTEEEINDHSKWHKLQTKLGDKIKTMSKGRNPHQVEKDGYIITSFENDIDKINKDIEECGFYILLSSNKCDALEALNNYRKRDCVEKVFRALKSYLGMDTIGVHSASSLYGKSLIWFIASIFHAIIFNKTQSLRIKDRKNYTIPSIIRSVDALECDKNLITNKYERRYIFDKKQKNIAEQFGLTLDDIDNLADLA